MWFTYVSNTQGEHSGKLQIRQALEWQQIKTARAGNNSSEERDNKSPFLISRGLRSNGDRWRILKGTQVVTRSQVKVHPHHHSATLPIRFVIFLFCFYVIS